MLLMKETMAGLIEGNGINNSFALIGEYIWCWK